MLLRYNRTMSIYELLLIAVGLSMDAFAISICKGLTMNIMYWNRALLCGAWFGVFQALMPIIGFFAGKHFADAVASFDHWIVFLLLGLIGSNMIREAKNPEEDVDPSFGVLTMFLLAVATSIDALAVGVSFAFLKMNIWTNALIIGCTTFIISIAGVKIGNVFGLKYKSKSEMAGGIILILIGLKILIEHLISGT